jgi:ribose 1,5-bisphosphokinase PhnN
MCLQIKNDYSFNICLSASFRILACRQDRLGSESKSIIREILNRVQDDIPVPRDSYKMIPSKKNFFGCSA